MAEVKIRKVFPVLLPFSLVPSKVCFTYLHNGDALCHALYFHSILSQVLTSIRKPADNYVPSSALLCPCIKCGENNWGNSLKRMME